jgi:hypothetical protein
VEKEPSVFITTTSSSLFWFEILNWLGENKGGDGRGP